MSRAIVQAWHKYTPFGDKFYEHTLDFQLKTLKKYQDEFDKVYFVDSTWDIKLDKVLEYLPIGKFHIEKVSPHLRYYDAYKEVLPQVDEDLVLFLDNDTIVYRSYIIQDVFDNLDLAKIDVVSVMDTIGTWKTDKLELGNKFCPYWFGVHKNVLMKYLDVDWSPDSMPDFETLGKLTKAMVEDGLRIREVEDDKTEVKSWEPLETEKNLGYYHVRSGSAIAVLLAWKNNPEHVKEYKEYITTQPKKEILRHCDWYKFMGGDPTEVLNDL